MKSVFYDELGDIRMLLKDFNLSSTAIIVHTIKHRK